MKAYVKDGVLDKILATPVGGQLEINPAEALIVDKALTRHPKGLEVALDLMMTGRCVLLGRELVVR